MGIHLPCIICVFLGCSEYVLIGLRLKCAIFIPFNLTTEWEEGLANLKCMLCCNIDSAQESLLLCLLGDICHQTTNNNILSMLIAM